MANEITAAIVTARPFFPANLGKTQLRGRATPVEVTMDILVTTTGSIFNYVPGGIPLDNLFVNGASDCGLDPNQKITQVGTAILRKTATTLFPALMAHFFQGTPSTGTNQTLILYTTPINAAQLAFTEIGAANATAVDLTAATALGAAGAHFCTITLKGMWREGTTAAGIDR